MVDKGAQRSYAQALLEVYSPHVLIGDGVAVPDDEEEMNWRIFFAHSQDMQGFQADVFTGGPNERQHVTDPLFKPLRPRWEEVGGDSRSLIADLGALWDMEEIRGGLVSLTRTKATIDPAIDLLTRSERAGAVVFAEALRSFRARKTNRTIRAYVQNANVLAQHALSYRSYLMSVLHGEPFPPSDVLATERCWIENITRFYNVGVQLANYMICDWLLWLWREGRIAWFESFKADSIHNEAIKLGLIPAGHDFIELCKSITVPDDLGRLSGRACPPRLLNECVWLDGTDSWRVWRTVSDTRLKTAQQPMR